MTDSLNDVGKSCHTRAIIDIGKGVADASLSDCLFDYLRDLAYLYETDLELVCFTN